jgi:hypothetical protein
MLTAFGGTFWMGGMLLSVFGHEHDNIIAVNMPMKTWACHPNTNSETLKLPAKKGGKTQAGPYNVEEPGLG